MKKTALLFGSLMLLSACQFTVTTDMKKTEENASSAAAIQSSASVDDKGAMMQASSATMEKSSAMMKSEAAMEASSAKMEVSSARKEESSAAMKSEEPAADAGVKADVNVGGGAMEASSAADGTK